MLIFTFKSNSSIVDTQIEKLQINNIFNAYYQSPLNIITDNWGYAFEEIENEDLDLNIVFDENCEVLSLDEFEAKICKILETQEFTITQDNNSYNETIMPVVEINDSYVLIHPTQETSIKNRINFISQGAFGTGLHETTKDILSYILTLDFSNLTVMDIGTGSGILSIATALKNAKKVTAIDIRDVKEEILLNSKLNNLNNIEVKIGNALSNDFNVDNIYDVIYINIGGEETIMFMDYINSHLKTNGTLLVSGLVSWSFDFVKEHITKFGYKVITKLQTNEWCTVIFEKTNNL
ncbi:MAG: 50S ribosomal protein L11 methyltransferase [Sarcina sp.]